MAIEDVIVGLTAFLGLSLNSFVVLSFLKQWEIMKPRHAILISFAAADILAGLTGLPMQLTGDRGIVCELSGYFVATFSLASISHIVALSVERMIVLKFPLKSTAYFTTKATSLWFIIPSWSYGILWGTFPWLGWGGYSIESYARHRCSIDLTTQTCRVQSYNYSLLVFCYIIPIVAVVICFVIIKREMRRMLQFAESVTGKDSTSAKATARAERTFTFVVLVMLISFFVAWTPYAMCVFYVNIHGDISAAILDASSYLGKTSSIFNPIIYVFMYKEFREGLRKLFNIRRNRVGGLTSAATMRSQTNGSCVHPIVLSNQNNNKRSSLTVLEI